LPGSTECITRNTAKYSCVIHSVEPGKSHPKSDGNRHKLFLRGPLQQLRNAQMLIPVGEKHLYYAAMNQKSCRLTPFGRFYRYLAEKGRV